LAIQENVYVPTSAANGSPTLETIHYQYATKPSGGGFTGGLLTLLQIGGDAGKNRKVKIPARPYLKLTEADCQEISNETLEYLQ
jgi:hypothetical protein